MDRDQFEEIKEMSDDDLIYFSYSQTREKTLELNRRLKNSVERLNENVEKLDKTTNKYSKILIWLTITIGILTAISTYFAYKSIWLPFSR
ncbi:MAG: hypothetical protein ABSC54_05380 [Smithellaceae bacterium]|jgi:hypothetical protein